jgi:hypothetical protein
MGEISDMMLDGDLCEGCGEYMEGGDGYARRCSACQSRDRAQKSADAKTKCPHPQCKNMKPRSQYACKNHWLALPKNIRDKVWTGFKTSSKIWLEADKEALAFWKGE